MSPYVDMFNQISNPNKSFMLLHHSYKETSAVMVTIGNVDYGGIMVIATVTEIMVLASSGLGTKGTSLHLCHMTKANKNVALAHN